MQVATYITARFVEVVNFAVKKKSEVRMRQELVDDLTAMYSLPAQINGRVKFYLHAQFSDVREVGLFCQGCQTQQRVSQSSDEMQRVLRPHGILVRTRVSWDFQQN